MMFGTIHNIHLQKEYDIFFYFFVKTQIVAT